MLFLCSVNHYNGNEVTSIVYSCLSPSLSLFLSHSLFLFVLLVDELFAVTFDIIIRKKLILY